MIFPPSRRLLLNGSEADHLGISRSSAEGLEVSQSNYPAAWSLQSAFTAV